MKRRSAPALICLSLVAALCAAFPALAAAPPIALDPGFGDAGVVSGGTATAGYHEAAGVAVTRSGQILVAGEGGGGAAVARFAPDGALDRGFGEGGYAHLPGVSGVNAIAVDEGGDALLLTGRTTLTRITPSGAPDPSFGDGGTVQISALDPRFGTLHFWSLALLPDGRILVAGIRFGSPRMVVVRLLPDGSPDPSFGEAGLVTLRVGPAGSGAFGIAVQADGDVVLAGYGHGAPALVRLLPDGAPDPAFGRNGRAGVPPRLHGEATALALAPRGGVLIAGHGWTHPGQGPGPFLLRYGPKGKLDSHFGPPELIVALRHPAKPVALLPTRGRVFLATTGPGVSLSAFDRRGRPTRSLGDVPGVPHRRFSGITAALQSGRLLFTWGPKHLAGQGEIRLERFTVR